MNDVKVIKRVLLLFLVVVIIYVLNLLSFIFIPLFFALIVALLFMPLMRWFLKRRIPKIFAILMVFFIIILSLKIGGELIQLSSKELLSVETSFWDKALRKLNVIVIPVQEFFGMTEELGETGLQNFVKSKEITQAIYKSFGSTFNFVRITVTQTLMTVFFLILVLAGSLNVQKIMQNLMFTKKVSSVKTFMKIESSIVKFLKVKFLISLATGIGFCVACWLFCVSFPFFWVLLAFSINFIQFLGSVISTAMLALFAFVELDPGGPLFFFILTIIAIQLIFGSVLEPIFMGQSFSINTITVLVMLMLWGFIWGIPGLILSVPITVVLKILLEQFPKTRIIATLMS